MATKVGELSAKAQARLQQHLDWEDVDSLLGHIEDQIAYARAAVTKRQGADFATCASEISGWADAIQLCVSNAISTREP